MNRWVGFVVLGMAGVGAAQKGTRGAEKILVPEEPSKTASETSFMDKKMGVSFRVPPGWELARKDGLVSTFHLDARTAPVSSQMRGVAAMGFNPFPQTTLSGASVYFSVQPKSDEVECARQATVLPGGEVQPIGGMAFTHGHDEHGGICVEGRDEVYTAYRRRACYRFDLVINTFCAISSGAQEISDRQIRLVEERMTGILSTVTLAWETGGATVVPVPGETPVREPMKK